MPEFYECFVADAGGSVLREKIGCTRAAGPPQKDGRVYATNLPNCKRGKNKGCRVEHPILEAGTEKRADLEAAFDRGDAAREGASSHLRKALVVIDRVFGDTEADLSQQQCRGAGDFLIGLEANGQATHALSTNTQDWPHIASLLGMEFLLITSGPEAEPTSAG